MTDLENRGVLLDSSTGRNDYDNGVSRALLQDPAKQQIMGAAIKKELAAWLGELR